MISFLALAVLSAGAAGVRIGDLYYELDYSTKVATVTYQSTGEGNYSYLPSSVVIPDQVTHGGTTYKVLNIGSLAFANCSRIESISIPASVTDIGVLYHTSYANRNPNDNPNYYASVFKGCTSLREVRFEDGSNSVRLGTSYYQVQPSTDKLYGRGLFADCPLEEVYIGRNIAYLSIVDSSVQSFASRPAFHGYSAFFNQTKLFKVTVGPNVTTLPNYLFYKCGSIRELDLGVSLERVGDHCFDGCASLTAVELPNTVSSIGSYSFHDCRSIQSFALANVTEIGANSFDSAISLKHLSLPLSLTKIGSAA
ncbi:MAG: leucine-rich repeat domain-containing protein, partial [Muribaculaceae bacterium]|nr:leucine-rich repeat domain-containing protein [Muribaculaceae bacterium]